MIRAEPHRGRDHIWFRRGGAVFEVVAVRQAQQVPEFHEEMDYGGKFLGLRDGIPLVAANEKWAVMAALVTAHRTS